MKASGNGEAVRKRDGAACELFRASAPFFCMLSAVDGDLERVLVAVGPSLMKFPLRGIERVK